MPVLANDNSQKPIVEARSSDKVMYYYKNPKEPLGNPCHVLGTQGATSGTNTATLGSTPTKQFNIKDTGRKNADGKWVVDAEYALVKISALPETEALNTAIAQNVTFEVTGETRRYDDNGNPFTLSAEDFDEGMFSAVAKYYNFTRPSQIGAGENGGLVSTATDDSKAGDDSGTVPMDQKFTAGSDTASSNQ